MNADIIDSLLDRVAENLGVKKAPEKKEEKLPINIHNNGKAADMRISAQVLRTQADIALRQKQETLSRYLRVAAEIAAVGEETMQRAARVISHGSMEEKRRLSEELESKYNAVLLAGIILDS